MEKMIYLAAFLALSAGFTLGSGAQEVLGTAPGADWLPWLAGLIVTLASAAFAYLLRSVREEKQDAKDATSALLEELKHQIDELRKDKGGSS